MGSFVRENGGPGTDRIGHTPVIGGIAAAIANVERLSRSEWIQGECWDVVVGAKETGSDDVKSGQRGLAEAE